ncbi:hypothetical protein SBV1_2490012 [Verrucomicrobia bacterium]|nr:hypothetical protein SBV1_2490012 [Verrucomicrobiota bacterium]
MNHFVSRGKYYIDGLREALIGLRGQDKKDEFARKLGIRLRTLTDIEQHSAISLFNWLALMKVSAIQQTLSELCPEGWGQNTETTPDDTLKEKKGNRWRFLRWEVDVRIQNANGDAVYQTTVCLENCSDKKNQSRSPHHTLWATTDSGVTLNSIHAYDPQGELEVGGNVPITTPSFLGFNVIARRSIRPGQMWRYWWEVKWPRGFHDLTRGDTYDYRGEEDVDEFVLKIVIPGSMEPSGTPRIVSGSGERHALPWVKLHGNHAIVFWRRQVSRSEAFKLTGLKASEPKN